MPNNSRRAAGASTPQPASGAIAPVVGRERELVLLGAAVRSGRDIVLEGPPGTSKTTMLRFITESWGNRIFLVEGNADLTPGKLIGHHDPARVIRDGYVADSFLPGPLIEAMTTGGFLYLEELNRAPEDALNTLLTAMGERRITVPRVATFEAAPTFRVIASMNPLDDVGTARLSMGMADRFCRLHIDYQDRPAERDIVALRAAEPAAGRDPALFDRLIDDAVAVTRATRHHPDVRQGSSVRGAIDAVLLALDLIDPIDDVTLVVSGPGRAADSTYRSVVLDALLVALTGRIHVEESSESSAESIVRQLWEEHLLEQARAEPG